MGRQRCPVPAIRYSGIESPLEALFFPGLSSVHRLWTLGPARQNAMNPVRSGRKQR